MKKSIFPNRDRLLAKDNVERFAISTTMIPRLMRAGGDDPTPYATSVNEFGGGFFTIRNGTPAESLEAHEKIKTYLVDYLDRKVTEKFTVYLDARMPMSIICERCGTNFARPSYEDHKVACILGRMEDLHGAID